MAEQLKSITEARQNLPSLSQAAHQKMDRYVITNQGKPQSVLVGYLDYQKMKAAVELLHRPDARESIYRGLSDFRGARRLTAEDLKQRLRQRNAAGESQAAAMPILSHSHEFGGEQGPNDEAWAKAVLERWPEPTEIASTQSVEPTQHEEKA